MSNNQFVKYSDNVFAIRSELEWLAPNNRYADCFRQSFYSRQELLYSEQEMLAWFEEVRKSFSEVPFKFYGQL